MGKVLPTTVGTPAAEVPTADDSAQNNTSSNASPNIFSVTLVRNTAPGQELCKVHTYDDTTRDLDSRASALLWEGEATVKTFGDIGEFMEFRQQLQSNEAIVMGRPIYDDSQIVTQDKLGRISPERRVSEKFIARDRDHIKWAEGPGVVMLDFDRPDSFPAEIRAQMPSTPEGIRDLLIELIPGLRDVQMAWAPSSSSYIYREEEELKGLRGQRFYVLINSGLDTPRFAEALHDALVLRGLVWNAVSKSGSRLVRLPFDFAVFGPEHLDFAAAPRCEPPLEQRAPDPIIWNQGGGFLSVSTIPATTRAQRRTIEAKLLAARQAKADEARAVREEWIRERGRDIALRNGQDHSAGSQIASTAIDLGVLLPDFVLTDSEGNTVTVGELLDDPEKNHGRRFCDPLEPDYRGDSRVAVVLVDELGTAVIHSHAHGGMKWRCVRNLPTIRLGLTNESVDEIHAALEQDHCGLYRNGNALTAVNEADATLQPLDADGVALRVQRRCTVLAKRKTDWLPSNIPARDVKALLTDASSLPVPTLAGVVNAPYARRDGSVVDVPGYDAASEVVYAAETAHPPTVRRKVGQKEAREALKTLWHPVSEFPFVKDLDRGIVLAALLSSVIRPSLPIAPGYTISARAAGTGKTLLAQTIGALQTGATIATAPLPEQDEEIRKHVFAALRKGSTLLIYDNVERGSRIESAVLANLVTSEVVEGRVLGESSVEQRPNRLTLILTGNNVVLQGDLNRRLLQIHLDANVEHPWQREFAFNPVSHVLANWSRLRIAALELFQGWIDAGSPRAKGSTGFPDWDDTVRSVVAWIIKDVDPGIGFADPILALREAYAEDPEADTLGAFLKAWHDLFGDKEIRLRDQDAVVMRVQLETLNDDDEGPTEAEKVFVEARDGLIGPCRPGSEAQRLGKLLAQHEGRVVGGLKLIKSQGGTGGSRRWRVKGVDSEGQDDRAQSDPTTEGGAAGESDNG